MLLKRDWDINRKRVQHYMQEMGLAGICPGPNLSKRNAAHQIYPYSLRNLKAAYPNHIWGIDITYIRLRGGWLYLFAVLDWFSRYVISWELDQTLEMPFVLTALECALAQAKVVFRLRRKFATAIKAAISPARSIRNCC